MKQIKTNQPQECPVCVGSHSTVRRFGLVRCEACGLIFSPAISNRNANEQINDEWFGEGYEQRKSSIWVVWFERHNNRRTLSRLKKFSLTGNRLLEIGVGSGSFLSASKMAGFEPMGCDLSSAICRHVEHNYGVRMHCGSLDNFAGEMLFDVVVMNHVLEHVQDPVSFLQNVHRLLAPGGFVHVAVPNIDCWEARLSGWTSYEPYHLIYFDQETIQRAIGAAKLSLVSISTHESFSGWFLATLRTACGVNRTPSGVLNKASATSGNPDRARPLIVEHVYRAAMALVGGSLWPVRRLQAALGRGDELLCIARKPPGGTEQ